MSLLVSKRMIENTINSFLKYSEKIKHMQLHIALLTNVYSRAVGYFASSTCLLTMRDCEVG